MAVRTSRAPSAVSALSERLETRIAAREVAASLRAASNIRPDLLVVFATFHHRALFSDAMDLLRSELYPAHLLACTAEGVIGDATEVERTPGLSAIALNLPNTVIRPFSFSLTDGPPSVWSDGFVRERVSLAPDEGALPHRGLIMLADPFSIHAGQACAAIEQAAGPNGARIFGGIASGSTQPGLNVLAADRRTTHEGIVGVSIFGDVVIDGLVSQGCRPVGTPFVVTKARGNEILELGGKPALRVAQEMAESLVEREQALLSQGLLVGIAYDASKSRLGRGDFLIRPVHAVNPDVGALALTDTVKPGTTIQFQIRDAETAHDDLAMLLSAEQLRDAPAAALAFSCNMRGTRMFAERNHDAGYASARLGAPPMAGFHAAGEIGPLGKRSFVHTQTASFALFREAK
jgi:small ligand-binding sensory domain FIST